MENKTNSIKRELLKSIIERYGSKEKKFLIGKAKEAGIYKNHVDDNEVYSLLEKFAEHHDLHIGYKEEIKIVKPGKEFIEVINEKGQSSLQALQDLNNDDIFIKALENEHEELSKKLLKVTQLLTLYKK